MIDALIVNYVKNNVVISVKLLSAILGIRSRSKEAWNKFEDTQRLLTWLAVKCQPSLVSQIEVIIATQRIKIEPT